MSMLMEPLPNRRLIGFIAASLGLHAALLYWLKPFSAESSAPKPLEVTLSARQTAPPSTTTTQQPPAQKSAVAARLPKQPIAANSPPSSVSTSEPMMPAPTTPTINMDAALATARTYAREVQPRMTLDAPTPVLTVESAIARATEPDVVIETRGANGEFVTKSKRSRCVTQLVVPHYMQGMTMPTLCDAGKS